MHITLGQIAAAGIEWQLSNTCEQSFFDKKFVASLRLAKSVLNNAHQDPTGKVLVTLQHVNIVWLDARHVEKSGR